MPEVSILQPRVLNGVVREFEGPEEFRGLAMAGTPRPSLDPTWAYDIIRASRGAHLIHNSPNAEAEIIDQLPYGHMEGGYAYLRVKKVFNATVLKWLRRSGELQVAARNANAAIIDETQDIRNQFFRAEEVAFWAMLSGTWTYTQRNAVTIAVDYGMPASHLPVVAVDWGTGSDTPLDDIRAWKQLTSRDAGFPIRTAHMNSTTMAIFLELPEVVAQLSDRQKDLFTREGVVPRFYGIDWIEYDAGYVNSSGTYVPYIPDDRIVFHAPGGSVTFTMEYGPSADLSAPPTQSGVFTKTWIEEDPSAQQVLMELNYMPLLFKPTQIVYANINAP